MTLRSFETYGYIGSKIKNYWILRGFLLLFIFYAFWLTKQAFYAFLHVGPTKQAFYASSHFGPTKQAFHASWSVSYSVESF